LPIFPRWMHFHAVLDGPRRCARVLGVEKEETTTLKMGKT
jgi:hypothetical protein